jgi:hypothetical protein
MAKRPTWSGSTTCSSWPSASAGCGAWKCPGPRNQTVPTGRKGTMMKTQSAQTRHPTNGRRAREAARTNRTPKKATSGGKVRARGSKRSLRKRSPKPIDTDRLELAIEARENGATLRETAAAIGVHVATLCRWQVREPWVAEALRDAETYARRMHYASLPRRRPLVPWSRVCPSCGSWVKVARTRWTRWPGLVFWRCSRWPFCRFASWRPRAPWDCPRCAGPRFWSQSRKSIVCGKCGDRVSVDQNMRTMTH